jgi:ketopantoate reductase
MVLTRPGNPIVVSNVLYILVGDHQPHFFVVASSVAEAADRPYSYVVLTTKAIPEVMKTPRILEPLLSRPYIERHPQPTYVLLQNGLGVERDLYHSVKALDQGEPNIISTVVWIGTNLVEKNVVSHNHFVSKIIHHKQPFRISEIRIVRR